MRDERAYTIVTVCLEKLRELYPSLHRGTRSIRSHTVTREHISIVEANQ